MLCEKCNKNQATFHYAEVINGVRSEHHLCSECAANTDVSFYSSILKTMRIYQTDIWNTGR